MPCSAALRSTVSSYHNSDESGKQSLYPDSDPDHHQNLITCSMAHCQPSLKLSRKSVWKLLHKVAKRQTDQQTNRQTNNNENITYLAEVIKQKFWYIVTLDMLIVKQSLASPDR